MYSQLKKTKSILSTLGCILHHTVSTIKGHAYKNIIKIAEKQGSSFIVHTERERKKILKINPSAKVHVYPIVWMEENSRTTDLKSQFVNPYPIIGLFGFISKYKNYELVANALIKEKFNIFIAGGTHPQSEEYGTVNSKKSSYQKILSDKFSIEQYKGRVLIKTAPSDEELITFIQSVDLVCIPYLETGQSGSGIASMAIQYGKKVIFSDNHCTTELTKFLNTKPLLFDVESPLSFISAANAALDPNYKLEFNGYNFENLINLYATVS